MKLKKRYYTIKILAVSLVFYFLRGSNVIPLNELILERAADDLDEICYLQPPFDWKQGSIEDDRLDFAFFNKLNPFKAIYYKDDAQWLAREKIAISLGYNCTVAGQFNNEQIRYRTFPFDWCESKAAGIIKCIREDFKEFLKFENLVRGRRIRVRDSLYKITIVHDFPFQQIADFNFNNLRQFYHYENAQELLRAQYHETYHKFLRRIERFRQLMTYEGKLYFIRCSHITKEESIELLEVLKLMFKKNNFTLVVINHTNEFKDSWNIPQLKNFFMPPIGERMFTKGLFTEIFKEVGLI